MRLLIRTVRDKFGSRNHIVFTDEQGISKPLGVFLTDHIEEFIKMYEDEQKEMDALLAKESF